MTWIKICGMTNLEDALVAADAGADAVGFVFYEKSPRCVSVKAVQEIVEKLPEKLEKVGVFVEEKISRADQVLRTAGLTVAQVYSRSILDWLAWQSGSDRKLMIAVPADAMQGDWLGSNGSSVKRPDAIVVDSGLGANPGGTGLQFDWETSKDSIWALEEQVHVVVAGGLAPDNVSRAIRTLRPWGVDVVSGVEASPGKKDPEKVRAFVRAVREADQKVG